MELPATEVSAFLDRSCGDDRELRAAVERLLAADLAATGFLEQPALEVAASPSVEEGRERGDLPASPLQQRLSHFLLIEKIGEGGMGVIYRARDEKLHRDVALKILTPELLADPLLPKRLLREARTAAAVNHPNVATIYEVGEADGVWFFAMEYVEGRTLRSLLQERRLPLSDAMHYASGIVAGLARAHEAHVIHRDLKPENAMIAPDGNPKILDFGLAKALRERMRLICPA